MSFLQRLFFSRPQPLAPSGPVLPPTRADKLRKVEVVGESFYQPALLRLAGPKTEAGVSVWKLADLIPDPQSKFDPNAVKVMIEGKHVGHLSRAAAAAYQGLMAGAADKRILGIKAEICGGYLTARGEDPDFDSFFGVNLYLPRDVGKALHDASYHTEPTAPSST